MVRQVSFGPFTLDADTRQLLCDPDQKPVHLSPKAYDLLCVLVERRPKAIAKADLHEHLWPSTFVSEATLASLIAELRDPVEPGHVIGMRVADEGRELTVFQRLHAA